MKRITIFGFFIFFIFSTEISWAELSVAIKEGYILFDESKTSPFEGNDVYDNELSEPGAYIRYRWEDWFVRIDYDRTRSGNTFENINLGNVPYEAVHFEQRTLMVGQVGRFFKGGFYLMGGIGAGFNDYDLVTFEAHPASLDVEHPTLALSLTVGIEKSIHKNLYTFIEARRLWEKQKVRYTGLPGPGLPFESGELEEDISNLGFFAGLGWRF